MNQKLLTLLTHTVKRNGSVLLFGTALLAACLGTLSGCNSTKKASEQGIPVQAETNPNNEAATKAKTEDGSAPAPSDSSETDKPNLPYGSLQKSESSATVTLYMESDSGMTLAYLDSFDGKQLTFDDAEWVDVPSDRARELNVEKEAADAGFYIYNEDSSLETLPVAPDCACTILDWNNSYEPKEIKTDELPAILNERENTNIPYLLTIEGQKIVKIEEHYVP